MLTDLRAALRASLASPGWAAAIIVTFAIAIGANTAVFSLVQALILRPLPFAEPHELFFIDAMVGEEPGHISKREFRELGRTVHSVEEFAGYYPSQYNVVNPPEALVSTIGTSNLFSLLGVRMLHGDAWPASMDFQREYQVVIGHDLWQQRFGARPGIVGESIVMDGASYRVAGVLPSGFAYPVKTAVYRSITNYDGDHLRRLWVIARVHDGRTLADLQGELDRISAYFEQAYPDSNAAVRLRARPLADLYVGDARPYVLLLPVAVIVLLVVASANVANLMLSRALARQGEVAVRLAMGARAIDIARLSMLEALVLASAGAAAGVAGSYWALQLLMAMVTTDLPPWFDVRIDMSTLAFTSVVTLLTAVSVGLVPAWHSSRIAIEQTLRQEAGRNAGPRGSRRWRGALLAAQAAMAAVLIISAAIFGIGLRHLNAVDLGFDRDNVLTFRTDPPFSRYAEIGPISLFYRQAIERLRERPGVIDAATNQRIPFSTLDVASPRVLIDGTSAADAAQQPFVNFQVISPNYFDVMRIPIASGRAFTDFDLAESERVAIVSRRAAARFWGTADPIGRRISLAWNQSGVAGNGGAALQLTVVGVVGDVRSLSAQDPPSLDVYAPVTQTFAGDSFFVIRTTADAAALAPEIGRAIAAIDPEQSHFDVMTMTERVQTSQWQHRVAGTVLAVFAVIAFALAVIGVHAATAYAVEMRRSELGIRLALGGDRTALLGDAVRRALAPVAAGLGVGLAAGGFSGAWLARQLPISGWEDQARAGIPVIALLIVAAIAAAWPALRVMRSVNLTEVFRR